MVLFAVGSYWSKGHDEDQLKYAQAPQVNDVYEQKLGFRQFTTMKVAEVTADSVFVYLNDYETNKRSSINEIDIEANYYKDQVLGYSKEDIVRMVRIGDIEEINRK